MLIRDLKHVLTDIFVTVYFVQLKMTKIRLRDLRERIIDIIYSKFQLNCRIAAKSCFEWVAPDHKY